MYNANYHFSSGSSAVISRKLYITILFGILCYSVIRSYLKYKAEPTAFEETEVEYEATFPSMTFCSRKTDGKMDNYTDFKDVMDALHHAEKHDFAARIEWWGKGVQTKQINLRSKELVESEFNLTLDQLWTYAPIVQPWAWPPQRLIICATLNPPQIKAPKQGQMKVIFEAKENSDGAFYLERHEAGNSRSNYDFDLTSGFDLLPNWRSSLEVLAETETIHLKKSTYDCYDDNSMKMAHCINDFYAQQLGCQLPWATESNFQGWEECQSPEALVQFRNLSYYITTDDIKAKVEEFGCLKPNCRTFKWVKTPYDELWTRNVDGIGTYGHGLYVVIPFTSKLLRRQEVMLADFGTFAADCGSYLGLFLGMSVLTITDIFLTFLKKFIPVKMTINFSK